MDLRALLVGAAAVIVGGCSLLPDLPKMPDFKLSHELAGSQGFSQEAAIAGGVGGLLMAADLSYFAPQYLAGALVAYAFYDPLTPSWRVDVRSIDPERIGLELRMKALISGGEGEARQVFMRNARRVAEAQGASGFVIVRYEEGMESLRPFSVRTASGEIRVVPAPPPPSPPPPLSSPVSSPVAPTVAPTVSPAGLPAAPAPTTSG